MMLRFDIPRLALPSTLEGRTAHFLFNRMVAPRRNQQWATRRPYAPSFRSSSHCFKHRSVHREATARQCRFVAVPGSLPRPVLDKLEQQGIVQAGAFLCELG